MQSWYKTWLLKQSRMAFSLFWSRPQGSLRRLQPTSALCPPRLCRHALPLPKAAPNRRGSDLDQPAWSNWLGSQKSCERSGSSRRCSNSPASAACSGLRGAACATSVTTPRAAATDPRASAAVLARADALIAPVLLDRHTDLDELKVALGCGFAGDVFSIQQDCPVTDQEPMICDPGPSCWPDSGEGLRKPDQSPQLCCPG